MGRAIVLLALVVVAAGCASGRRIPYDPSLHVAADRPPAGDTWAKYRQPRSPSCWARHDRDGSPVLRAAPTFAPAAPRLRLGPQQVADRLLARFGDRRFVHGIRIGPASKHWAREWTHGHAPSDGLFARIDVPLARVATGAVRNPSKREAREGTIANWEATLVGGALRDELCAAGGRPLVGWSGGEGGVSSQLEAFGQRFPNPPPAAFGRRVRRVGRRYGFRVVSLRLLRPLQLAPLLVVETDRNRRAFVADVPAIVSLLDPTHRAAATFEGLFFEAEDGGGPFLATYGGRRGTVWGGTWTWRPDVLSFAHG